MEMTYGDVLDAIALCRAALGRDAEGIRVLIDNGDQAGMLAAVVTLYTGLLSHDGNRLAAVAWLDDLGAGIVAAGGVPLGYHRVVEDTR